ncbi:hypothetical protein KCP71_04330 [Salmonella enterica subsp. enterica]|nr:hypothetical protein KCP71_04330 [Salmonella enterica subsp. enterica]
MSARHLHRLAESVGVVFIAAAASPSSSALSAASRPKFLLLLTRRHGRLFLLSPPQATSSRARGCPTKSSRRSASVSFRLTTGKTVTVPR